MNYRRCLTQDLREDVIDADYRSGHDLIREKRKGSSRNWTCPVSLSFLLALGGDGGGGEGNSGSDGGS